MRGITILALAMTAAPLCAQEKRVEGLSASGSVRLRYEAIAGQLRPGFNADEDLANIRTTLRLDYKASRFHATGELYDSRVALDDPLSPITGNEVNTIEPVQVFVGADIAAAPGIDLTLDAGRMLLNIASRRLVAADDYRNTTNGYTGVRLGISGKAGWEGTLIYVLPQVRLPDEPSRIRRDAVELDRETFDLVLWGGTLMRRHAIGPFAVEASYYHLGERDRADLSSRDRSLDTYGGRIVRDPAPGHWAVEVEGFVQTGRAAASTAANAPRLPVGAWMLHADTGYTFTGGWRPRVSVDFDLASGDRPGGRYGRFDLLFGMRRADFSPAGLLAAIGRANIVTAGPRVEVTPGKHSDALLSVRPMWLESGTDTFTQTGLRDARGASGRYAGTMVDARLRHWVAGRWLRYEFDGTLITHGGFLEARAPSDGPTLYLSSNLTATF
jgi:hypothetical protein